MPKEYLSKLRPEQVMSFLEYLEKYDPIDQDKTPHATLTRKLLHTLKWDGEIVMNPSEKRLFEFLIRAFNVNPDTVLVAELLA